ncbi:MAG: hypothetical protein OXH11_09415, partial [Candidatus Aminicenantes bacterium]|nr:hypothetical protein [Candidatus Aminicenantes bacterium]
MLVPKDDFIGLDDQVHLCAGGETPVLKSHQDAVARFFRSKARGEDGRQQFEETYLKCKERAGRLFNVSPEEIA